MCAGNVSAYIGLLIAASATIWLAQTLCRRYPIQALRFYRTSIVATLAVGFLRVFGNYVAQELLWRQEVDHTAHVVVYWVFRLLSVPFSILALYAFVFMLLLLAGKRFTHAWRVAFLAAQIILAGLPLTLEYEALATPNDVMSRSVISLLRAFEGANTALLIVLLLIVLRFWHKKTAHPWRRGIIVFALVYSVLFVSGYLALFWLSSGRAYRIAYPIVIFFTHPIPLIYMYLFLRRHYQRHPSIISRTDSVEDALSLYGVSSRETEVVRLLIQGKSYRDIQNKLYISMPTVKTHVSNIYKKMAIRNRWQLLRTLKLVDTEPDRGPDALF